MHRWQKMMGFVLIAVFFVLAAPGWLLPRPQAPGGTVTSRNYTIIIDALTQTFAGVTADTALTPTTAAHRAEIQWRFGTVTGSYTTCTAQAKTTYDGTNFLTLGTAVSVTVTSATTNAWTVIEQLGTTSVTSSAVSATAALGFGTQTKYTFACAGYGTTAPVTISIIYR